MSNTKATPQDALVILKLYSLRREAEMRKARDYMLRYFWPETLADVQKIMASSGDDNRYCRMVYSYWNMAAALVNHGAVNAELFAETEGEIYVFYAKIQPFLPELRKTNPQFLMNIDRFLDSTPSARQKLAAAEKRLPGMRERLQKS